VQDEEFQQGRVVRSEIVLKNKAFYMCWMDDQGDILDVGRNESSVASILVDELSIKLPLYLLVRVERVRKTREKREKRKS
jgi:hypothetical protein